MSVHIGELHTDVLPASGPASQSARPDGGRALAEKLREAAERARRLADRVAAEGFDD